MDHGACSDLHPVADPDISDEHGARADQTVVPDHGRLFVHLPDGNVLINPAPFAHAGVPGDKDSLQPVGKHRPALDHRVRADITSMAVCAPAHQKGQHIMQQTAPNPFLPPVQPPEMIQVISSGIFNHASSDTHPDLLAGSAGGGPYRGNAVTFSCRSLPVKKRSADPGFIVSEPALPFLEIFCRNSYDFPKFRKLFLCSLPRILPAGRTHGSWDRNLCPGPAWRRGRRRGRPWPSGPIPEG